MCNSEVSFVLVLSEQIVFAPDAQMQGGVPILVLPHDESRAVVTNEAGYTLVVMAHRYMEHSVPRGAKLVENVFQVKSPVLRDPFQFVNEGINSVPFSCSSPMQPCVHIMIISGILTVICVVTLFSQDYDLEYDLERYTNVTSITTKTKQHEQIEKQTRTP
ncbi:hypothetical protein Droror1_Dr00003101 [Drosera rotundifolia]